MYVAGAVEKDGKLFTSGGRVLGVCAVEETLECAVKSAYEKASEISFENAYYRNDIGAKALKATEK